ncbi:RNA polymerase II degradation factor 1 isoform X2 [Eurytemora carolleeae]|uniref:RNA polymerase II degradation factor 1 isoform X2 n=1 Tax=Eurytemora carolleeae TaxID=1294199 RepID=UPI000C756659|nr:RNA polymerase II degradation factor 1 isoform X2 [Eurytemora carolleeae]|eukprot:XP_023341729.1 RNA polymerase II degradation factor 1-like isoform X2 [Eurytemora affinis]
MRWSKVLILCSVTVFLGASALEAENDSSSFRSRSQFRRRLGRLGSEVEDESQLTDEPSEADNLSTGADLLLQSEPEVVKKPFVPRRTSIRVREGSQSTQSTDSEISNVAEAEVDFTEQEATRSKADTKFGVTLEDKRLRTRIRTSVPTNEVIRSSVPGAKDAGQTPQHSRNRIRRPDSAQFVHRFNTAGTKPPARAPINRQRIKLSMVDSARKRAQLKVEGSELDNSEDAETHDAQTSSDAWAAQGSQHEAVSRNRVQHVNEDISRTRHRLTQNLETERTADRLAGETVIESAGNQVGQSDLDSADAGNNEARETQGLLRPGFQPNRKPGFNSRIRPHARIPSETPEINPALVEADVPVLPVASIPASSSLEETSTVDLDDPTPEESVNASLIESEKVDEPETVDQSIIQSDLEPIINQSSLPAQPPVFIPVDVAVETNQQVESQPPLLEETDQPSLLQETNQPNPTQELNQLFLPQAVDKPNLLEAVNDPILPQELDEQAVELSTNEGEEEVYYYYYYDDEVAQPDVQLEDTFRNSQKEIVQDQNQNSA